LHTTHLALPRMGSPSDTMAGAQQNGVNGTSNRTPSSYASRHDLADHFFGGNSLSVAAPGGVKDFVASNDGHTVITSVSRQHLPY